MFGAGNQGADNRASREKRDDGMVLFGKGWPVSGSMIAVEKRPPSSVGEGTR